MQEGLWSTSHATSLDDEVNPDLVVAVDGAEGGVITADVLDVGDEGLVVGNEVVVEELDVGEDLLPSPGVTTERVDGLGGGGEELDVDVRAGGSGRHLSRGSLLSVGHKERDNKSGLAEGSLAGEDLDADGGGHGDGDVADVGAADVLKEAVETNLAGGFEGGGADVGAGPEEGVVLAVLDVGGGVAVDDGVAWAVEFVAELGAGDVLWGVGVVDEDGLDLTGLSKDNECCQQKADDGNCSGHSCLACLLGLLGLLLLGVSV